MLDKFDCKRISGYIIICEYDQTFAFKIITLLLFTNNNSFSSIRHIPHIVQLQVRKQMM